MSRILLGPEVPVVVGDVQPDRLALAERLGARMVDLRTATIPDGLAATGVVSDTVRRFEFQAAGAEVAEVWQAGYFNDLDRAFHRTLDRHVDDVLRALRAGEPPPIPAAAGRRALALALASIRSFETGNRVDTRACDLETRASELEVRA